ncbi:MAG: GNAT family N-acetyltransferase [Oscillospiraceae bacterium]|nr:GNAT family N-acetyltransferase [Oscillospiraceae bacterium]
MINIYIETKRLIIRPVTKADYPAFVAGYRDCLPPQNPFDEGAMDTDFMTEDWFRELLSRRRKEAEQDKSHLLDIFRKADWKAIGYCDITVHQRECLQYGRIGYTLHNPYWGQGYGTECAKGLVQIGFEQLHLHRLEAHVDPDNPASKNVLRKTGFTLEVVRKQFEYEDGEWQDREIYVCLNGRWKPRAGDRL